MIDRHTYKETTWIDLVEPTSEEIESVIEDYNIDSMVARELLSPSLKHRFEKREEYLYLILHFPAFKQTSTVEESQEVDFIIGKDFIITTHYEQVDALERFAKLLEVETILNKNISSNGRDLIFFGILNELAKNLSDQLSFIEDWIKEVKLQVFNGREKEMVIAISDVSRNLLDFKKITDPYHDALKSLEVNGAILFGQDFAFYTRGIREEFTKAERVITNEMVSLAELRETNNSLLTTKQNEVMKVFTVMALFTFPMTLIVAIFTLPAQYVPLIEESNGFYEIITILAGVAISMFSFFKFKKWI
jgi:magnesium transporter